MTHIQLTALLQTILCCLLLTVTKVLSTLPTYTIENSCNRTVHLGEHQFGGNIAWIYKPTYASNFSCEIHIETTPNSLIHYFSHKYLKLSYCEYTACECDPQIFITNGSVAEKYCFSDWTNELRGVCANKLTVRFQSRQRKRSTFQIAFYSSNKGYCDSNETMCDINKCLHNSIACDVGDQCDACAPRTLPEVPTLYNDSMENGCNRTVRLGNNQFREKILLDYNATDASHFSCETQIKTTSNSSIHFYSDKHLYYCSDSVCECDPQIIFTNGTDGDTYCFSGWMSSFHVVSQENRLIVRVQSSKKKHFTFKFVLYTSHKGYCKNNESMCAHNQCLHTSIACDVDQSCEACPSKLTYFNNDYNFNIYEFLEQQSFTLTIFCATVFPFIFLFVCCYICCWCCCCKEQCSNGHSQTRAQHTAESSRILTRAQLAAVSSRSPTHAQQAAVSNRNLTQPHNAAVSSRDLTSALIQTIYNIPVQSYSEVDFDHQNDTVDERTSMDPPTYNSLFASSEQQCYSCEDLPPTYIQVISNQEVFKVCFNNPCNISTGK